MSDVQAWPISLNHRPMRGGYRWRPHDPQSRTAMEQGAARKRRRWVASPAYVTIAWVFDLQAFELFRAWHHAALADGALWFRMPVYTGSAFVTLPCRFNGVYGADLQGLEWHVTAELEVRDVSFLSVDDHAEIAVASWPEALNPLPLRDDFRMTPHRPVIRGDLDGPKDTKLWYQDGVTSAAYQWAMSGDGFELFRAWYHVALADGVAWFDAPVWVGGDFGTRHCRIADMYEAELQVDYTWLVQAEVEVREVPYMADGALYVLGVIGGETWASLAAGIHQFVHQDYPEAVA